MTHRLTSLLALEAETQDDRFPLRALFQDAERRKLAYVALGTGGWFDRREVLVSIDRFGRPGDGVWPLDMTTEEVSGAPHWEGGQDPGWSLPPLVIGPLGYTFSPLLMATGMAAAADRDLPRGPEGEVSDLVSDNGGRLAGMERSSDWLGREAFGPAGSMGRVADLVFDADLVLSALVLDDGAEIQMGRLRNEAEQGHLIFD